MYARYAGLHHLANGKPLDAMADHLNVLVTVDTSIGFQHVMARRPVAVPIVRVPSNALMHLQPRAAAVLAALATIQRGTVVEI